MTAFGRLQSFTDDSVARTDIPRPVRAWVPFTWSHGTCATCMISLENLTQVQHLR